MPETACESIGIGSPLGAVWPTLLLLDFSILSDWVDALCCPGYKVPQSGLTGFCRYFALKKVGWAPIDCRIAFPL